MKLEKDKETIIKRKYLDQKKLYKNYVKMTLIRIKKQNILMNQ